MKKYIALFIGSISISLIYALYLFYFPRESGMDVAVASVVAILGGYVINSVLVRMMIGEFLRRRNMDFGKVWEILIFPLSVFIAIFPSAELIFSFFEKSIWNGCNDKILPKILELSCKWETLTWSRIIINFIVIFCVFEFFRIIFCRIRNKIHDSKSKC